MSKPFDPEAHLAHMAPLIGLAVEPAWRPAVVANLAATAAAAELVLAFPLADHEEPAPVFEP
jgi:hypothetical protein